MSFTIFPAIDLRDGQVVRLQLGDPERQTIFDQDPRAVAERWVAAGANWLHVVNLDGAFDEAGHANWKALPTITKCGAQVQFGGGMRAMVDIEHAFECGVQRVVLGTTAVEQPDLVEQCVQRYGPHRVAVGIDARDGFVRTRGWQSDSTLSPQTLALQMKGLGVQTVIYTDISRDGVLQGVNMEATSALARATGLQVVASGGVAGAEDVRRAAEGQQDGVCGLIIGRAIYDGHIHLQEALQIARQFPAGGQAC